MRYIVVSVMNAGLVGYAVLDTHAYKFTSLNLFSEREAAAEITRHNDAHAIKAHWPAPDDPDVMEISAEFTLDKTLTTAYALHRASEIVARRRAGLPEAS